MRRSRKPGRARSRHRREPTRSGAIALALLVAVSNDLGAQSVGYSLDQVVEAIRGGVSPAEVMRQARMRCIAFAMTDAVVERLEVAGATREFAQRLGAVCNLPTQGVLAPREMLSIQKADGTGLLYALEARVWGFWAVQPLGCSLVGRSAECGFEVINGEDPIHAFCLAGASIAVTTGATTQWLEADVSLPDTERTESDPPPDSLDTREVCTTVEGHGGRTLSLSARLPTAVASLDAVSFRLIDEDRREEVPAWAEVTFRNVFVER